MSNVTVVCLVCVCAVRFPLFACAWCVFNSASKQTGFQITILKKSTHFNLKIVESGIKSISISRFKTFLLLLYT